MEIARTSGGGSGRDTTAVTSAATVELDLAVFARRYVRLTWDQGVFFTMGVPGQTLSVSGAVTPSLTPASPVGERVTADAVSGLAQAEVYVDPNRPIALMRAISTSTTYTEVVLTSVKVDL